MKKIEKEIMTIREFCEWLGLGYSTYFYWQKHTPDVLPKSIKIGRKVFITESSIKEWQKRIQQ